MSPTPILLLSLFAVREESERDDLVRRGYELLPNARWLEELERDRDASLLGGVLPSPTLTVPSLPDFERLDYDRQALYPQEAPITRINLKLRPWSHWWDYYTDRLFPTSPRFPHEPWFMQ